MSVKNTRDDEMMKTNEGKAIQMKGLRTSSSYHFPFSLFGFKRGCDNSLSTGDIVLHYLPVGVPNNLRVVSVH